MDSLPVTRGGGKKLSFYLFKFEKGVVLECGGENARLRWGGGGRTDSDQKISVTKNLVYFVPHWNEK